MTMTMIQLLCIYVYEVFLEPHHPAIASSLVREYYEKEAFSDNNGDKYVNVAWLHSWQSILQELWTLFVWFLCWCSRLAWGSNAGQPFLLPHANVSEHRQACKGLGAHIFLTWCGYKMILYVSGTFNEQPWFIHWRQAIENQKVREVEEVGADFPLSWTWWLSDIYNVMSFTTLQASDLPIYAVLVKAFAKTSLSYDRFLKAGDLYEGFGNSGN